MSGGSGSAVRVAVLVILLGLVALIGAGAWAWNHYQSFVATSLSVSGDGVVEIARGESFRQVLARLRKAGIAEGHDLEWHVLAREMDVARRLHVGEYAIDAGLTPRDLLAKFASGRVIQYRVTIVEGWNFRELRAALAEAQPLVQAGRELNGEALMSAIDRAGQHPEGRFLPETYLYTRGTTDIELLRRANRALEKTLSQVWEERDDGLPIDTPEQALILASLIEKETGAAGERPQIAGVFVRRLRRGMRLQTDPSVIYGMGDSYQGRIGRKGLDTDTPYNTYTRDGLPPTPIAMPGRAALRAAVHPADGDSLYFVSKGDGSHHFSATLAEHNRAVARYILGRRNGASGQGNGTK